MKKINIEEIINKESILKTALLTKEEITNALKKALEQIDKNMEYFNDLFPTPNTIDNKYNMMDNTEWTNGFWTGLLWLAYEFTRDEKYMIQANHNVDSFIERVDKQIALDHHDLGFLYTTSCVSAYKLTKNEGAKEAAIKAADKLITRYHEVGEFIQAWGEFDNPKHYRFIIDCMLNLPLLFWASNETKDPKYKDIALKHFNTNCENIFRSDASAYHTFFMDPVTGAPVKGITHQGFSDDSSWARGQAWGIYGLALNYHYTANNDIFPIYKGVTNYFLNRLPSDNVCYWDLIFNDLSEGKQSKDSSAAVIAVCGLLEMDKYLSSNEDNKEVYQKAAHLIMRSIINNYTFDLKALGQPLLKHGVYSWHSGKGVDEGNIWGDYFYLEALMRLYKDWELYW